MPVRYYTISLSDKPDTPSAPLRNAKKPEDMEDQKAKEMVVSGVVVAFRFGLRESGRPCDIRAAVLDLHKAADRDQNSAASPDASACAK